MHSMVLVAAVGVLAVIAYGDVRFRRIPNALCLAIATLGLIRIASARDALATSYTLLAAVGAFAATFLLFWRGVIGGGDAKLVTAMTLLIGHRDLFDFLFLMSLFGGALGLAALGREKLGPKPARFRVAATARSLSKGVPVAQGESTVPYGVAIAAAGVITLIIAR
jgi:prepilin peptidase CpaA